MSRVAVTVIVLATTESDATTACGVLAHSEVLAARVLLVGGGATPRAAEICGATILPELTPDASGLAEALAHVATDWVGVVGPSCVPDEGWLGSIVAALADVDGAACAGGRVFELSGARTTAQWRAQGEPLAAVSWHGSVRSHLGDLSEAGGCTPVEFVDGRCMVLATDVLSALAGALPGLSVSGVGLFVGEYLKGAGVPCAFTPSAVVVEAPSSEVSARERRIRTAESLGYDATLALLCAAEAAPMRGIGFLLVGQKSSPGTLSWPVYAGRSERADRWRAAQAGRRRAVHDVRAVRASLQSVERGAGA